MAIDTVVRSLPGRLQPASAGTPAGGASSGTPAGDPSGGFVESLAGLLASVDASSAGANSAIADMVQGKGDVHEAMLALQRAETTLQLTVQVRNKLVQAYQDVMRMPI